MPGIQGRCRVSIALAALSLVAALIPSGPGSAVAAQEPEERPAEGRLLVLNKSDNTLMVFEVPSYRRLSTIPVGTEPHEVVAAPDGRKAYVSNVRDRTVSVIDLTTQRLARTVRSEHLVTPHGLAVTPDGRHLLLTSEGSRRFFLIDAGRDVILRSVTTTQERAHMVAVLAGGRKAFAANIDSDTVTFLKLPELRIVKHVRVGDGPEGIAATPNGKWVLVALQGADQVAILDPGSGAVLARLPTGRVPVRVAVTPNSFTALVSNRASNDVTVLDVLERRVKTTVRVGQKPGGIVTNDTGTRAYVCNNDSNTVSVLSVPGFEVVDTIEAGAQPDGIAFVPVRSGSGKRARSPRSGSGRRG
jgi:YVTN family beta-propeller protein